MNQHPIFRSDNIARWMDNDLPEREFSGNPTDMKHAELRSRDAPAGSVTSLRYRPFEALAVRSGP